ncbi:TIGR01177 family methyltransferase [Thermoplasma volcanium]|uniref:TIGR01177 family methyltransferase n=1 Tax=Thermoplasma volcanium TaxID=50339 RepID=UPI0000164E8B|nr:TIGR01177 family methyltransferase [Thermoplasma volcanium]
MSDTYLLELSLERDDARKVEILSIQETYEDFKIEYIDDFIAVISGNWKRIERAAFVNTVGLILSKGEKPEDLKIDIPDGFFYIRYRDIDRDWPVSEAALGDLLNAKGRISFTHPNFVLRVVHHKVFYLTMIMYERDKKSFEIRKAPKRPFFSPVSMHPKYARFLVNCAHVRENETILDPFCGTGGILIEAALMGIRVVGNDVSLAMAVGARTNLSYFHVENFRVYNKDVRELDLEGVDGIATDMPYGRNSYHTDEITELYEVSFQKFSDMLKPGGYAAFAVSQQEHVEIAKKYFEVRYVVPVYQHRSLTRYFVTARNKIK